MTDVPSIFEIHITIIDEPILITQALKDKSELSMNEIKKVMQKGAVWLTRGKKTHRVRRAKKMAQPGDSIHLYYNQGVLECEPLAATLVSDEGHYSIWNKPCGLLSQGSKWGDHCAITRYAESKLRPERPSFVVHRLDRAANGLIIIAHSKTAAAKLSALFQKRLVNKRYQIVVRGKFTQGPNNSAITVDKAIDGRAARSHFSLVSYCQESDTSVLDVDIDSGRKHQIRRHVAFLGHPICGDRLYGNGDDSKDLQLSAYYLEFCCPFTHRQRIYTQTS
jgi:tRNA pseudouridine32 synthase/23S rRNA pseudouridine746 synthase